MKSNQQLVRKLTFVALSMVLITFAAISSQAALRCHRSLLAEVELSEPRPLKESESADLRQNINSIWNRMLDLKDRMGDRATILRIKASFSDQVDGVQKVFTGTRDALIISTKDMPFKEVRALTESVEELKGPDVVSFPLQMGGGHLHAAFRGTDYDVIRTFNSRPYALPAPQNESVFSQIDILNRVGAVQHLPRKFKSSIETLIPLTSLEAANLARYIKNIQNDMQATIGSFDFRGGTKSTGRLDSNLCLTAGHNCTSWIALAPIGANGESLMKLVNLDPETQWGTNPGYLTAALLAEATPERQPLVIIYTTETIEGFQQKNIGADGILDWDYSLH